MLTDAQRILLEDKFVLWDRNSREGNLEMRDYHRRAGDALKAALSLASAYVAPPTAQPGEVERLRAYAASCERTTQDMIATTAKHFAEVERLRSDIKRLEAAIRWALGEGDSDFGDNRPVERPGQRHRPYWWRTELRARAALTPSESQEAVSPTPDQPKQEVKDV